MHCKKSDQRRIGWIVISTLLVPTLISLFLFQRCHKNETDPVPEQIQIMRTSMEPEAEAQKQPISISYNVPEAVSTSFKAWMPYTAITDTSSKQWKLQEQSYTDENGFRRIGNDYIVAMGTYYADECGNRFSITLDSGKEFTVIVGDIKADIHTDENNMYSPVIYKNNLVGANVLEFIVDPDRMCGEVLKTGTVSRLGLEGDIVKIERITGA